MKVNVTRRGPTTALSGSIVEHVANIMTLCGIEMLEIKSHGMGLAREVVSQMTPFSRCPAELVDSAAAIKDALGVLLASAGATAIVVSLDKSELGKCVDSWRQNVARMAPGGGS